LDDYHDYGLTTFLTQGWNSRHITTGIDNVWVLIAIQKKDGDDDDNDGVMMVVVVMVMMVMMMG